MAQTVTLVKGDRKIRSANPTTITQLKAEGWRVEAPKPKPAPVAPKGDDK